MHKELFFFLLFKVYLVRTDTHQHRQTEKNSSPLFASLLNSSNKFAALVVLKTPPVVPLQAKRKLTIHYKFIVVS